MTSLKEFLTAKEKCEKYGVKALFFVVFVLVGWIIVGLTILGFGKPWLGTQNVEYGLVLSFVIGMPWILWNFMKIERHQMRYPDLQCPHCKKPLGSRAHIVIATRNCFHCGEQVIDSAE